MIDFSKISHVWMIGIGGIGMSALARYFAAGGFLVGGYDRAESSLTGALISEGILVIYKDDPHEIPGDFLREDKTLVIYTPAVSPYNKISTYFREKGFRMHKRAEILGIISRKSRSIAIAGTHGKTSVTTITAHLLKQSNIDCSAFLGGISKNYRTNLLTGGSNITVMEADEFDRSFHYLSPEMALITSMDADHLDIYGSFDNMVKAYVEFAGKIKNDGILILNEKIAGSFCKPDNIKIYTYGLNPASDFHLSDISKDNDVYSFSVTTPWGIIDELSLLIPGKMNVENSIGAIALAKLAGVSDKDIRKALFYYKGVFRRFDVRINSDRLIYIDDYAHHPQELKYCIESVREFYGKKKITGIFQPHLFTRTRDLADAFADALDKLDRAILLPVYPAREEPIEGVNSGMICDRMKLKDRILAEKDDLPALLKDDKSDIVLTLGAGDIDRLVEPIENILLERLG
ncbi:MAG: UDP-N-acetylmuramate--L-alanine ligase [Bacteroidales bacterium]|nr:UDP-N-acetylmuramate--L-alanine ligase [Bacteroidales bacterium]